MEMIWEYRRAFSLRHSSCIGIIGPYMAVLTLSWQLNDGPHKIDPFVRACQALAEQSANFKVARYILAMLKALSLEHGLEYPEEAIKILNESTLPPEALEDVPMEMRIPIPPRSRGRQSGQLSPGTTSSESVGELLARWTGPSSEEPQ
jgi:hypothetical protein